MNLDPGKGMLHKFPMACLFMMAVLLPAAHAYYPGVEPRQISNPGYQPAPWNNPRNTPPVHSGERNPSPPAQQQIPMPGAMQPYGQPWQYPGQYNSPYYDQRPGQTSRSQPPRVEIDIESSEAYVHQNLVVTIDVISSGNLSTVNVLIPDSDAILFRKLSSPSVRTRTSRGGKREIINRVYYQLTPLRSGVLEIPAIKVNGNLKSGAQQGAAYEAAAPRPIRLTAMPPATGVLPWLPLRGLELSASLADDQLIREGRPLTLIVKQTAIGLTGAQLPSLESQLQSPHQSLYRKKSDTDGQVSKDGRLVGTRIDHFTLVPQQGNQVQIPAIKMDWWNVDRQRKETAIIPGRLLNSQGDILEPAGSNGPTRGGAGTVQPLWLWLGAVVLAFFAGIFWKQLRHLSGHTGTRILNRLESVTQPARQRFGARLVKFAPQRQLPRLRRIIADSLPCSYRLWFCVRSADGEQDPNDWSQVLRFLINRRLKIPAQIPMSQVAEIILDIHQVRDPDQLRLLLNELEASLYSDRKIDDFARWKRDFKHQIRPRLLPLPRRSASARSRRLLPALNPNVY